MIVIQQLGNELHRLVLESLTRSMTFFALARGRLFQGFAQDGFQLLVTLIFSFAHV